MSANSVLLKYLPLEKQIELTQQLIEDGDLEQALEIVTITGIDLSTNDQLIDYLFNKITNQIDVLLADSNKTAHESHLKDNEFTLLLKFVSNVSTLRNKLDQFALSTILTYIKSTKEIIFDSGFYVEFVKPLLTDITAGDSESSSSKKLNDTQLVLFLQLLEIIYIQDEKKLDMTIFVSADSCLIALLGCNVKSIALQSSQLIRWRYPEINQLCNSSNEFSDNVWAYLIELFKNCTDCNWKLKISLIFLLRSVSSDNTQDQLVQFIQTDDFWIGIQFALNHDVIEYRKIALSIVKKIVEILSSSDNSMITTSSTLIHFNWDVKDKKSYKLAWKRYITLYEIVALDTNLESIQKIGKDISKIFDDSFIPESWGLVLCSTGLKSSMRSIKEYIVSLMLELKNKSVFSTNLQLLRSTLLPSLMDSNYFKTGIDHSKAIDDNCCPHGISVRDLFCEILAASKNGISDVLATLLQSIIDTDFVPAKIYCCDGIVRYATKYNSQLFNATHLTLLTKLFATKCNDPISETTLKTYLFSMLNYVNEQESSPTQWIKCMSSHLKNCHCDLKHFDKVVRNIFQVKVLKERYVNQRESVQDDMGIDAMFDALCMIYLHIRPKEHREELQAVLSDLLFVPKQELKESFDWIRVNESIEKNIENLLKPENLKRDDMDIFYEYGATAVSGLLNRSTVLNQVDFQIVLDYTIQYFSPGKLKFLRTLIVDSYPFHVDKSKQLHNVITQYCKKNSLGNYVKDDIFATFTELVWRHCPLRENRIEYLDELFPLIIKNITENTGCYRYYHQIMLLCDLNIFIDSDILDGSSLYSQGFESLCTIWNVIANNTTTQNKLDLQYGLIDRIFSSENIFTAISNPESPVKQTLHELIKQICDLSFHQRGFLPHLAAQISSFMEKYKDDLTNLSGLKWLSSSLVSIFVQKQNEQNAFRLESVMSHLYDSWYTSHEDKKIYVAMYRYPEMYSKLYVISAILKSGPNFQNVFISYLMDATHIVSSDVNREVPEETERILEWQLLLMTLYVLSKTEPLPDLKDFIKKILQSLEMENSIDVRVYKEWIIAFYICSECVKDDHPTDLEDLLFSLLIDHSKPFLVVSVERILFLVLKAQKDNTSKALLNRFISVLVPNATSNKPLVRHFSNSLVVLFWPIFEFQLKTHNMKDILENLFHNAQNGQKNGKKIRVGDAKVWDLYDDLTLAGIFGNVTERINGLGHIQISAYAFNHFSNCLNLDMNLPVECSDQKPSKVTIAMHNSTKEDEEDMTDSVERSDLIVVASLVDKPFNLGGICRLCDVLGAKVVTMQDLKVVKHPQFKDVSLSSDQWMPMEEVPIDSIAEYMQEKKAEGYTLIGLEQTDKSIRLDEKYNFPEKSLILLGTEAYGIPGPLLGELDLCLEIQQHGVIRSMNIQTATAVIVHSYTIQHL